jgi:hypothetical protein
MIESVIMACIYLVLFAIAVYILLWVLEQVGITIPPKVMQLLWVLIVLVALLFIIRLFVSSGMLRFPHAIGMGLLM